jgi:two-component system chemotaxis response regulator CheB
MRDCPYKIVVVGTSLGGLNALQVLLPSLPKSFPLPVAIVQHRHKDSKDSLSDFLQGYCPLPLTEAEDKEAIIPGRVYLAPPDYHLLVEEVTLPSRPKQPCAMHDPPLMYYLNPPLMLTHRA